MLKIKSLFNTVKVKFNYKSLYAGIVTLLLLLSIILIAILGNKLNKIQPTKQVPMPISTNSPAIQYINVPVEKPTNTCLGENKQIRGFDSRITLTKGTLCLGVDGISTNLYFKQGEKLTHLATYRDFLSQVDAMELDDKIILTIWNERGSGPKNELPSEHEGVYILNTNNLSIEQIFKTRDTLMTSNGGYPAAALRVDQEDTIEKAGKTYVFITAMDCTGCEPSYETIILNPITKEYAATRNGVWKKIDVGENSILVSETRVASEEIRKIVNFDYPVVFEEFNFRTMNLETFKMTPFNKISKTNTEAMAEVGKTYEGQNKYINYPKLVQIDNKLYWDVPVRDKSKQDLSIADFTIRVSAE